MEHSRRQRHQGNCSQVLGSCASLTLLKGYHHPVFHQGTGLKLAKVAADVRPLGGSRKSFVGDFSENGNRSVST